MRDFSVFIITNSNSDLTKIKFPEFDIVNIRSEIFAKFCERTFTRTEEFLLKIDEEYQYDKIERFAIIKKDNKKFGERKIHKVFNFLLILFPSTLSVEYMLDYQTMNDDLRFLSVFHNEINISSGDTFLTFEENKIDEINIFVEKYFENYLEIKYLKSSIQNYLNAFDSNYFHFSFIAFCICLESITVGKAELNYRIARNIAVICGKDRESSHLIFKNIKKIYNLRSEIVHGTEFSDDKVSDYLYYLELICSKLITELLKHNINNIDSLNEKITTLGFGERNIISENWNNTSFNDIIENRIYVEL
jgi:hypothetical protein